jgi:hypothetical protein
MIGLPMIGLLTTTVFAAAGCFSAGVIGHSVRTSLPALRRLAHERRLLAEDRAYLYTLIETPRHDGTMPPAIAAADAPVAARVTVRRTVRAMPQIWRAAA